MGLDIYKQEVDAHFTERTATWLLAVLRRAVQLVVSSQPVSLSLLRQFTKVLLEDGSTIPLPAVFKDLWRGCGGNRASKTKEAKTEAARSDHGALGFARRPVRGTLFARGTKAAN